MMLLSLKAIALSGWLIPDGCLTDSLWLRNQRGIANVDIVAALQFLLETKSHREADRTVSELGSSGVAIEVTQPA